MNTDDLVRRLVQDARPVVPLPGAGRRAAAWLGGTAVYLGLFTAVMASRADLAAYSRDWSFVLAQAAALATGIFAASAALASVVPGARSRSEGLALGAAALWVLTLILPPLADWSSSTASPLSAPREWLCVAIILLGGGLPAVALVAMARQGAPLRPRLTVAMAALAASALANVTACLSLPHPSSLTTLVWHGVTAGALVAAGAFVAPRVLRWPRRDLAASS